MNTYLQLTLMALLPIAFSAGLYLLDKKTPFGKLDKRIKQVIYGVAFGGIAVMATELGVNIEGAVLNVRDAAVLSAGLFFGAPAGIIAGLIGGLERFFAVYWGAGTYTQIACTVSTILAGLIGAALRKYMFDDKKPSWVYALAIGIVTEVVHMLMIFITNFNDIATAFLFVGTCSLPMITVNALSVALGAVVLSLLGKEKLIKDIKNSQISTQFQRWLLIVVVFAGVVTGVFTLFLQSSIADTQTDYLLSLNISDVKKDISDASDANLLSLTRTITEEIDASDGELSETIIALTKKYSVVDVNVVDENNIIIYSTNSAYIGYDMSSGEQSNEFSVLLSDTDEYAQSYQAISYDSTVFRKYAGVKRASGGYVQVSYDAEHFQQDIATQVKDLTTNRHIGQNGSVLIIDMNKNVVSGLRDYEGQVFGDGTPTDVEEGKRFSAVVYGKKSYCMYELNEGYIIMSVLPVEEAVFTRDLSVYITAFMEIIVFVGLFIVIYFLIKKLVVNNIKKVNETLSEITGGNLNVKVEVRTNEEFASLSDDINSTVITLKQYIAEAAARIDKELEFAKAIQHSALPSVFPPFPHRKDFDIFASMDAAKEVGGDFYDFYFTNNNEFVFLIADVSGKGIPAAMFMMRAKSIMKNYAEYGMDVDEIFTKTNSKLCEGNDADMFVTAWIGKIDLSTGDVTFANAGHNPPIVKRVGAESEYVKSRAGLVLAGMDGIKYKSFGMKLNKGDVLYLYTDGVTEATDAENRLYGEQRLKAAIDANGDKQPDELCKAVKADVELFVGTAPQFDDITMLSIKYNGADAE